MSLTPRVFAPNGGYATSQVAIGFKLARSGAVTLRIYDRSGRLVSTVVNGQTMNAGDNIVRWDGRARDGRMVNDGLYMVSVEALGQRESRTLAVVR